MSDQLRPECMFVRDDINNSKDADTAAKSVYYIPASVCQLMRGDQEHRLKIVCAGIKVFEKKVKGDNDLEYRLVQEGIHALVPFITTRKVFVTAQDFSNLLGGGLVSFNTLSPATVQTCSNMPSGALICVYKYSPEDVVSSEGADASSLESLDAARQKESSSLNHRDASTSASPVGDHCIYAICWRGNTRTLNVMCKSTGNADPRVGCMPALIFFTCHFAEIEAMRHQLSCLRVLRPRINVPKRPVDQISAAQQAVADALAAAQGSASHDEAVNDTEMKLNEEADSSARS